MTDPPPKPTYRSVKTSLKSVIKNNLVTEKLTDTAFRANSIMIHALQLLKLYLLHCCGVGDELPKLDRRFVTSVMKLFCKAPSTDRPPNAETQIITDVYLVDEFRTQQQMQRMRTGRVRDVPEMREPSTVQERYNLASRAGQVYDLFEAVELRYERRVEHLEGGDKRDPRRGSSRVPSTGASGAPSVPHTIDS